MRSAPACTPWTSWSSAQCASSAIRVGCLVDDRWMDGLPALRCAATCRPVFVHAGLRQPSRASLTHASHAYCCLSPLLAARLLSDNELRQKEGEEIYRIFEHEVPIRSTVSVKRVERRCRRCRRCPVAAPPPGVCLLCVVTLCRRSKPLTQCPPGVPLCRQELSNDKASAELELNRKVRRQLSLAACEPAQPLAWVLPFLPVGSKSSLAWQPLSLAWQPGPARCRAAQQDRRRLCRLSVDCRRRPASWPWLAGHGWNLCCNPSAALLPCCAAWHAALPYGHQRARGQQSGGGGSGRGSRGGG